MERTNLVDVLSECARTLVTDCSIQHVLDQLIERIAGVLPALSAGITLIDSDLAPQYAAASTPTAERFEAVQTQLGQGPNLAAYKTGQAVLVPDLERDSRFLAFAEVAGAAGLRAVFAFPLRHGNTRIGALALYRGSVGTLDDADLAAAQTLADVAAAYLLNATARDESRRVADHFHYTSLHDPLTGLANRALLHERLDHAAARAHRTNARAALMYLDLDGFKQVNDAHGHDVGDQLLAAVATRLSLLVRPGDTLARLAGDEFVFLCEDVADTADAERVAERLTEALRQPFELGEHTVTATASIGLVFSTADEPARELLGRADAAMYEAKRRGGARYLTDLGGQHPAAADRNSVGGAAFPTGKLRLLPHIRA